MKDDGGNIQAIDGDGSVIFPLQNQHGHGVSGSGVDPHDTCGRLH